MAATCRAVGRSVAARPVVRASILACLVWLLGDHAAQARGLVLITRGDTIHEIGAVAPAHQAEVGALQVGYKFSYFGVFWLDFWTWGGEYCLFHGDNARLLLTRQVAARLMGKNEADVQPPLLYRFPVGLLLLAVVLVALAARAVQVSRRPPPQPSSFGEMTSRLSPLDDGA